MSEYPKKESASTSNTTGYAVEARYAADSPKQIGAQIFDNRWRRVEYQEGAVGIPNGRLFADELRKHSLFSYSAAQALRWWLHAAADASPLGGICLESKLVKYEIKTTSTCKAVSEHKIISGDDRSNCIPDWGKNHE